MVLTDLKYVNLVSGTFYKVRYIAEILSLIVFYEIVAASVCQNCQMLVLCSNHAGCHLVYGTVASACYKTGLTVGICLAVVTYVIDGGFLCGCKINFKINGFRKLFYVGTDYIGVTCFPGFVVNDETIMHGPDKLS